MENHATIFTKNTWQFKNNKEKEFIVESMGKDVTIFTKNAWQFIDKERSLWRRQWKIMPLPLPRIHCNS